MTRGSNRFDVPLSASSNWINYDCPVESWEYWESDRRFAQEFSPELRKEISIALTDFRDFRKAYDESAQSRGGKNLDSKEIERELRATIKKGAYPSPSLEQLVEMHCTHLPNATITEKASYILEEFTRTPEDFRMERPLPDPLFTRVFYELFHRHDIEVPLGSSGTLYGKGGMGAEAREKEAPETPFVEFVRRCIWETPNSSASFCARVRKVIQRCPVCSKL